MMLNIFAYIISFFCTMCVMLLLSTGVALFEFAGEKRVVDTWWNTMLLNISASFDPLFGLIMVVPRRTALWASTHVGSVVVIVGTVVLYYMVDGDYANVFSQMEYLYYEFVEVFLGHVMYNLFWMFRFVYEAFVPIWNIVTVAITEFVFHIWNVISTCDVAARTWLYMFMAIPRAFGSVVSSFVMLLVPGAAHKGSNLVVNELDITPSVRIIQEELILPFQNASSCYCADLKPIIVSTTNVFAHEDFATMVNAYVNIPVAIAQAIARIVMPDYGIFDVAPIFKVLRVAIIKTGAWLDYGFEQIFTALLFEMQVAQFAIPKPFIFEGVSRMIAGVVSAGENPIASLSSFIEGNYDVMYAAMDVTPAIVQMNAGAYTISKSAYWVANMISDGPAAGQDWPIDVGPLQCAYYNYEYYSENGHDFPTTCHCGVGGCGAGGTCMLPTGKCKCKPGFHSVVPHEVGTNVTSFPCIPKCTTDASCLDPRNEKSATCLDSGYCKCEEGTFYNMANGICYDDKSLVDRVGPTSGPPDFSWTDCTDSDTRVPNIDNPVACMAQHALLAPIGALHVFATGARRLFFGAFDAIEHKPSNWVGYVSFLWQTLQDMDGVWYPRQDPVDCVYRREHKDDCTTYSPNCKCGFEFSDIHLKDYDPYCAHPTLNANVYSHLDGLSFYAGLASFPKSLSTSIGTVITASGRTVVEGMRLFSRGVAGAIPWALSVPSKIMSASATAANAAATQSGQAGAGEAAENAILGARSSVDVGAAGNLAYYPTNCFWGTTFTGPVPDIVSDTSFGVGGLDKYTVVHEYATKLSGVHLKCAEPDTTSLPGTICKLAQSYMTWSKALTPTSVIRTKDAVKYINSANRAILVDDHISSCQNRQYCESHKYNHDTPECGEENSANCYCNTSNPVANGCQCVWRYPERANTNIEVSGTISYHNHLLANLFGTSNSLPWCSSMFGEWFFFRQSELFVGLENFVDSLKNGNPLSSTTDECMKDKSAIYQIVRKSTVDSMYALTDNGYKIRPVASGNATENLKLEQSEFWRPCDVAHKCTDKHCWCPLWVHNDLVCNVGLVIRYGGWTSIEAQRQFVNNVVGVTNGINDIVDIELTGKICMQSQTVAASTAALASMFAYIPGFSVASERRMAAVLYTVADLFFIMPLTYANVLGSVFQELVEDPSQWSDAVTNYMVSDFMLVGTTGCQGLLALDRALNGIDRDGSIIGARHKPAQYSKKNPVGPLLLVGDVYTNFIGGQFVDVATLGAQMVTSFITLVTGSSADIGKNFEPFIGYVFEALQTWVGIVLKKYAKIFEVILALLPPPVNTLFKWILQKGCFIVQGTGWTISEIINGAATILGQSLENNFDPSQCMENTGPANTYPGRDADDDASASADQTPSRRLLQEVNEGVRSYALLRDKLDWNGTTFCAQLGQLSEPPSTPTDILMWQECASNRIMTRALIHKHGLSELPPTLFDHWTEPVYFGVRVMRAMLGVWSGSGEDMRYLKKARYPIETARAMSAGMYSLTLGITQGLNAKSIRTEWLPGAYPDFEHNVNGTGARINRVLSAWENLEVPKISERQWANLFGSMEYHTKKVWGEIIDGHARLAPPAPAPISVLQRVRRRLEETAAGVTTGGVALTSNRYARINDPNCSSGSDAVGICIHCRLLTSFLAGTIDIAKDTGDFYKHEFSKMGNQFAMVMHRQDPKSNDTKYPRIARSHNAIHFKNTEQPHITTGTCKSINVSSPEPCVHGPANVSVPLGNHTLKSKSNAIMVLMQNSTALTNALTDFFTTTECNVSIPVFEKPLWCWVVDIFQPCDYAKVAFKACQKPHYSVGDSFRVVVYLVVGLIVVNQFTGFSIPFFILFWILLFAFLAMRYNYKIRCAPVLPVCLTRDLLHVFHDITPNCFCHMFRSHLLNPGNCTPGLCASALPSRMEYTNCKENDLGYFWSFFFFIRWQAPEVLAYMLSSQWSPFSALPSNSAALRGMQYDIRNHLTVSQSNIECFYAQMPYAIGVFLLLPLILSCVAVMALRLVYLVKWVLFSIMLSGSFMLDAVPEIDRYRTMRKLQ